MAEHNHKKLNVAIIGGGVSALSVAYHLKKMGHGFTIFEKAHHIGGNARTIPLRVAGRNRWVDLGVNDFNYKTYRHLVQVFNELGVEYRRLEDTTSYADIGEPPEPGRILETGYTMDGQWKTEMPPVIRQGLEAFQRASVAYFKDPAAYQDDTVEVFAAKFNLSPEFLQMNLYARISGMYFAGDSDPSQMPIRMVMHYYNIQEGLGQDANPDPIRMYWVGGTRQWIVKLAEHLQKGETNNIRTRTQATFESLPDGRAVVYSMKLEPDCKTPIEGAKPQREEFDCVVLGVQAWDVHKCYHGEVPEPVQETMAMFDHSDDEVVPHTYSGVLPQDVNAWRTYNIKIFPPQQTTRYTITYVCNRHQNDADNPEFANSGDKPGHYASGDFFLTVNPYVPVPKGCRLVPERPPGCTMFRFYHNILNFKACKAQDEYVPKLQGLNNTYFVGGYTKGSGLHEECWIAGMEIAKRIDNPDHRDVNGYDFSRPGHHAAPEYMRRIVKLDLFDENQAGEE